jgi:hypothetical protein
MELPLILSLFGAVALTLVVPAIRGMHRRSRFSEAAGNLR